MTRKSLLHAGVATGAFIALGLASPALAAHAPPPKAASSEDLDALRSEVDALKAVVQDQATQLQSAKADLQAQKDDSARVAQAVQADRSAIQTIPTRVDTAVAAAKPKPAGWTLTMGGFVEAASIYRSKDETADISSSFSKLPFANDRASHTGETRFTARQSRYSALVQGAIDKSTTAAFYGEFDFQGGAQTANSNQSNSYNPRIRNLYGQVDWNDLGWHLLAGQNWSLVTMNTKGITPRNEQTPPQIDAQYIPGFAWARQPQVRLTKDFNKTLWLSVSVENPQTTFGSTNAATGVTVTSAQAPTNGFFNGTNYSLNTYPDVVGKAALEETVAGRHLHLEAFGIFRSFEDRVTIGPAAGTQAALLGYAAGNATRTTSGGGGGAGVVFEAVPRLLDVEASIMAGDGIGRYGSAGLPDVTTRPDGSLQALPEVMWLAGGTLHATPKLDVYVFGGREAEQGKVYRPPALPASVAFGYGVLPGTSNAGCAVEGGACSPFNKAIGQVTAGFWDKLYQGPFGRVQVGMQYSHTDRETFADAVGYAPKASEDMLFTSFRYYPF